MTRFSIIRIFIALYVQHERVRTSIDVKTAFLNAKLEEQIYVTQPQGFMENGKESHVYLLLKALYGLKQASRLWNKLLHIFLMSIRFHISRAHPALHMLTERSILVLIVDYFDN